MTAAPGHVQPGGQGRMRVLITGISGTGKSAVVRELRRRGCTAYDADDDGYTEPAADGVWCWRVEAVHALLATTRPGTLYFAGCSDEQARFDWDRTVLLTAPEDLILTRLRTRTSNTYGRTADQQARVLEDLREFEPRLRCAADAVIETSQPLPLVVDAVQAATNPPPPTASQRCR